MAAVLTLQALHEYAGRETAEAVRFDVRWKAAIGSSLEDAGPARRWCTGGAGSPSRAGHTGSATRGLHETPAQRGTRCCPGRHLAGTWLKLRDRGVTKNHAWLKRRTAALNLRNLTGRGLARQGGAWMLVT